MNDSGTTVSELRAAMAEFVRERDWNQFHSPKNLAMSISIEAAELMEHFQWMESGESRRAHLSTGQLAGIGEEIADVVTYALALVNELELDLTTILREKMIANRRKYPADRFRGRYGNSDPRLQEEPGSDSV